MDPTLGAALKAFIDGTLKGTPTLFAGVALTCAVVLFGQSTQWPYLRNISPTWLSTVAIIGVGSSAIFLVQLIARAQAWFKARSAQAASRRAEGLALTIDRLRSFWHQADQGGGRFITHVSINLAAYNPGPHSIEVLESRLLWPFWWGDELPGSGRPLIFGRKNVALNQVHKRIEPRSTLDVETAHTFAGAHGPRRRRKVLVRFCLTDQMGRSHYKWALIRNPDR